MFLRVSCLCRESKPCPPTIRGFDRTAGTEPSAALPVSINSPVLGTLCLQPKLILCFWVFTFPLEQLSDDFFFLTDEGGPGNRAAVCLWKQRKKKNNQTHPGFSSLDRFNVGVFSTNCVSDLLPIGGNPSLCNISPYFCEVVMWM